MNVVLTTAGVPDDDKLDYWSKALTSVLVPLVVAPRSREPLSGLIAAHHLGYVQVASIEADPQRMSRTPRHTRQPGGEFVTVCVQNSGRGTLTQDGRTAQLTPGALVVYDTSRPYTLDQPEPFRLHVFQVPRAVLGISEAMIHQVTAAALPPEEGVAGIFTPFLNTLASTAAQCSPRVGEQLGDAARDLLAALISAQVAQREPTAPVPAVDALALRVRGYVNQHLADPDLSPHSIAAHHHISVRYLHKLFESEGTSIGRWIQQRRLEECSRELTRRSRTNTTVSSIAQRWGFANPTHFSRAFRTAYGMSPREWRSVTLTAEPSLVARAAVLAD